MAHTTSNPAVPELRLGTLLVIVLIGATGFALGRAWPEAGAVPQVQSSPEIEDWHGNVRRSTWPE